MAPSMGGEFTELLRAHREGRADALADAFALVYENLRRMAHRELGRMRLGETLDTTALVHELYVKLVGDGGPEVHDRNHFFALAARAMRQIVIDHARGRSRARRGGGVPDLPLERAELGVEQSTEFLLAVDEALDRLAGLNERLTRVFECRYFAGLSESETAEALDIPLRTAQRDWMKGKAWLRRELGFG